MTNFWGFEYAIINTKPNTNRIIDLKFKITTIKFPLMSMIKLDYWDSDGVFLESMIKLDYWDSDGVFLEFPAKWSKIAQMTNHFISLQKQPYCVKLELATVSKFMTYTYNSFIHQAI